MSDAYQVSGESIEFATGARLTFDHKIGKVLEFSRSLVLLVTPPPKVNYPLNVFGLSKTGEVLWRVHERKGLTSPYADLIPRGQDSVRLANWDGTLVDVNPESGEVVHQQWAK